MGLFNIFKKLFSKPIKMDQRQENQVVCFSRQSGKIDLNKKLVVPPNHVCFLVCKEKVCDKFIEGEHKLSINNLPLVTRTLKLNIPNKKGKYKDYFNADIYFVKLDEISFQKFESQNGVYIKKDEQFLPLTGDFTGKYSYKLIDPESFLESLLMNFGIIKGNLAQRQLDIWTGLCAEKKIEKNKPSVQSFNERESSCFNNLIEYMNQEMRDIGVEYTGVNITKTILPKRVYKKTKLSFSENIKSQNSGQNAFDDNLVKQDLSKELSLNGGDNNQVLMPFENSLFSNDNNEEIKTNFEILANEDIIESNIDLTDSVIQTVKNDNNSFDNGFSVTQENIIKPIIEDEKLQSAIKYKTCSQCGAVNPISSKSCFNCKARFKKICEKCGKEIDSGDFVCPHCKSIVI